MHASHRADASAPQVTLTTLSNKAARKAAVTYLPLETQTRPTLGTAEAAYYLNRQPQTLRSWASLQNGPLRPLLINGRLAWSVADIRRLLGIV